MFDEREVLDHIRSVGKVVRQDSSLFSKPLRFGLRCLGVSWLNDMGYCEYKFEHMFGGGVPVDVALSRLPPSDDRDVALLNLARLRLRQENGVKSHDDLASLAVARGRRPEFQVAASYCGCALLGCMDLPFVVGSSLCVVDWKTGDPPWRGDPWNGDVLQLLGYCYIVRYALDRHPVFNGLSVVGTLVYTRNNSHYSVDFDSSGSVVRDGFTKLQAWSEFTPSGLADDKIGRLWLYFVGAQEAVPASSCLDGKLVKAKGCEFSACCIHSPMRVLLGQSSSF